MANRLLQDFLVNNQQRSLFEPTDLLLVGLSGGVDSMVLGHLLLEMGCRFEVAHVHFGLRGKESEGDADFVRDFANRNGLKYHQLDVDTTAYAKKNKCSIQEAARRIRYDWFELKRVEIAAQWIAVAHQKDDVAETMIFNLTRGTGLSGLHGIRPKIGQLIRPLLFAERQDVVAYAKENQVAWRADSSNESIKYARNLIRHQVIPSLRKINPEVVSNMAHTAQIISELELLLDTHISDLKSQFVHTDANQTTIQLGSIKMKNSAKTILYYLIKEYGFNESQVKDILASGVSGKVFLSTQKRAVIHGDQLLVSDFAEGVDGYFMIESWTDEALEVGDFELSWELLDYLGQNLSENKKSVSLSADNLLFPLILRKRKAGDWFQPLGMDGHKKKIKKFLTDLKLSLPEKEKIWVLETADRKICWVVGYRMDERFRVHGHTRKVFNLQLKKNR